MALRALELLDRVRQRADDEEDVWVSLVATRSPRVTRSAGRASADGANERDVTFDDRARSSWVMSWASMRPAPRAGRRGRVTYARAMRWALALLFVALPAAAQTGSLSREEIRTVVVAHVGEIRACYERELADRPTLAGRSTFRFTIGPDGRVVSVEVSTSTDPAVDACAEQVISGWVFPPPHGGGTVVVSYPFVFEPT